MERLHTIGGLVVGLIALVGTVSVAVALTVEGSSGAQSPPSVVVRDGETSEPARRQASDKVAQRQKQVRKAASPPSPAPSIAVASRSARSGPARSGVVNPQPQNYGSDDYYDEDDDRSGDDDSGHSGRDDSGGEDADSGDDD